MKRTIQKQRDIVRAAVEEFRLHGFEGARITRVAESAGVSSRTLYKHFPSKETLFDAIIEMVVLQTGAIPSRHYEDGRPLKPQLVEALTLYMNAITDEEYMGLNRVMMSEYLRDRELALRVFERSEMHNNPIRTLINEAIEAGVLREVDADYATVQLTASMKAFFFWPKFIIGQEAPDNGEAIIEDCVEMFLNYYQNPSNN